MVRPARFAGSTVHTPPPWSVPDDRAAPAGTPEMVTSLGVSEPAVSPRAAVVSGGEQRITERGGRVDWVGTHTNTRQTPKIINKRTNDSTNIAIAED